LAYLAEESGDQAEQGGFIGVAPGEMGAAFHLYPSEELNLPMGVCCRQIGGAWRIPSLLAFVVILLKSVNFWTALSEVD
jgi:hypothetical protein